MSLWLRGSKESSSARRRRRRRRTRGEALPSGGAVLGCTRTPGTAQLFSVFCLPTHPYRQPRGKGKAGGPREGRGCCKVFIGRAAAEVSSSRKSRVVGLDSAQLVSSSLSSSRHFCYSADCQDTCTLINSDQFALSSESVKYMNVTLCTCMGVADYYNPKCVTDRLRRS